MFKTHLTILMFPIVTALAGCGTTGDLYIPEQRYPLPEETTQATPDAVPDRQPIKE